MQHGSAGPWASKSAAGVLVSLQHASCAKAREAKHAIRTTLALPEHGLSFHVTVVTASQRSTARKELCSLLSHSTPAAAPQQNAQARLLLAQSDIK